uniref:Cullin family profile domain-containing protein n=1 Tax=Arcella intermedia TaxID=1963864 RepID=A0A6B2L4E2_9EUKA
MISLLLLLVSLFVFVWLFSDSIKKFFGKQTAEVAYITLDNKNIQIKAKDLGKDIVNQLLDHYSNDEETRKVTTLFVKKIIEDPKTAESVVELVNKVIVDPKFQAKATSMAQVVANRVINDPATVNEMVKLLEKVMAEHKTQQVLSNLMNLLINRPEVVAEFEKLAGKVVASEIVYKEVNLLSERTSNRILENPELIQKMSLFLQKSVDDPVLQQVVGDALWESIKIALTPSILRTPVPTSDLVTPPSPQPIPHSPLPSHIPSDKLQPLMELLFRSAYELIDQQYGPQFTSTGLQEKKKAFESALSEIRNKYRNCHQDFSDKFMLFIRYNFDDVFKQEQDIIDIGGEETLIILAKTKIDKKIGVYRKYLNDMEKLDKGYFYDSYKPTQLKDREGIVKKIEELEAEKLNNSGLLSKEISTIRQSPVAHMYKGSIGDLLGEN